MAAGAESELVFGLQPSSNQSLQPLQGPAAEALLFQGEVPISLQPPLASQPQGVAAVFSFAVIFVFPRCTFFAFSVQRLPDQLHILNYLC